MTTHSATQERSISKSVSFYHCKSRVGSEYRLPLFSVVLILNGTLCFGAPTPDGPSSSFDLSSAVVGDVNGDGILDFVVGMPQVAGADGAEGKIWCYSGRDGKLLYSTQRSADDARFGFKVAPGDDLNADGTPDFFATCFGGLVVQEGADSDRGSVKRTARKMRPYLGKVFALSGADGSVVWERVADHPGDFWGSALVSGPDVDGDHYSDLIVSAPNPLGAGYVEVLSGKSGERLRKYDEQGTRNRRVAGRFGFCMAVVADCDQGGLEDLAIGVPDASMVVVVSSENGALLQELRAPEASDFFGISASRRDDSGLLVGLWHLSVCGFRLDKGTFTLNQQIVPYYHPQTRYDGFARTVLELQDIDQDGHRDIAIGEEDGLEESGSFYGVSIVSGESGKLICYIHTSRAQNTLEWAHDLDGDGWAELFIGTPSDRRGAILSLKALAESKTSECVLSEKAFIVLTPLSK